MVDVLVLVLVLPAVVVGCLALLFGLGQILSAEWMGRNARDIPHTQFKLWHVMATVMVAALLLHAFTAGPLGGQWFSLFLLCMLVLGWFVRTWRNEFIFLMGLRDDDLPGRNDKVIWAVVLLVFVPVSIWFFRSYRLAHWPEGKPLSQPDLHGEPGKATAAQPT